LLTLDTPADAGAAAGGIGDGKAKALTPKGSDSESLTPGRQELAAQGFKALKILSFD